MGLMTLPDLLGETFDADSQDVRENERGRVYPSFADTMPLTKHDRDGRPKSFVLTVSLHDMMLSRRAFLRYNGVIGSVGLAGCNTGNGRVKGLARIELANYDTTEHKISVKLSRVSDEIMIEKTITLAAASKRTDGEQSPTPTSRWLSDFPEKTGKFRLEWSIDSGDRETFRTESIQGCQLIRLEIGSDGEVSVSMVASVDCYGA